MHIQDYVGHLLGMTVLCSTTPVLPRFQNGSRHLLDMTVFVAILMYDIHHVLSYRRTWGLNVGAVSPHNLREGAPNRHSPLGTSPVESPHPERHEPIRGERSDSGEDL